VQVDARVIEIDPAVLDALDAGGDGPLPEASRAAIEKAILGDRARVTAVWSVLGMNAQRFHAVQLARRTYVASNDIADGVPDPVCRTILSGHVLDVRPTLVPTEPGRVVLEMRVTCCDLPDVLPAVASGNEIVQTPKYSRAEISTMVCTKSGETRLFSLGNTATARGETRRIVVWTVKTLE